MAKNMGPENDLPAPAVRTPRPGWRDPRLWVGVAILAGSVTVGARVLAGADDTVVVWSVADDVAVGTELTAEDLVGRRVRFADADDLDRYLAADAELPTELRVVRELGAGELLPRAALGAPDDADGTVVSLAVPSTLIPTGVEAGSEVDVYVLSDQGGSREDGPLLADVRVLAAASPDEALAGGSGERQVELVVPAEEVAGFYGALDALSNPVVSIVQNG